MLKSNLDLLNDLDQTPPTGSYYKFIVSPYPTPFGTLLEEIVKKFTWDRNWIIDNATKTITLLASSAQERTKILQETLIRERDYSTFQLLRKWSGELFPIYGPDKELILSIEKVAAPLFGVLTYGVQLVAYQECHGAPHGMKIWISKRSKTKRRFPGMLDSTVGGCMPTGETPFECLVRECEEEVSFSPALTRQYAKSCGTINYLYLLDERSGGELGCFSPEVQFCFEMRIPGDVKPVPGDDEVEEIVLMDIPQIEKELAKGSFTPANGCVMLDFFIRHGVLTFENEPDYVEIASRLHRVLDMYTA